jgi:hypothetical protein
VYFDMEQRDPSLDLQLQELRNRMDQGLAEADRGEGVDGEVFMQELIAQLGRRRPPSRLP